MDHKEKYAKILEKLIKKSFPELKKAKIGIVEYPPVFFGQSTTIKVGSLYVLFINKKCRTRKVKALTGQLAHELCHMTLDYSKRGLLSSIWHFIHKTLSTIFNTSFSRKIEIRTDRVTIKSGFAR